MILGIIIGFIIGVLVTLIKLGHSNSKEKKVEYERRGIYVRNFTISREKEGVDVNIGTVNATYELGEVDSTDDMSKVKVLSIISDRSEYNTNPGELSKLTTMIDNTWISSKDIKWINSTTKKRNDKIDQILK